MILDLKLPKNCTVKLDQVGAVLRISYATTQPVGVFPDYEIIRSHKGKNYIVFKKTINYQNDFITKVYNAYRKTKRIAMIINREQKINILQNQLQTLKSF